MVNVGAALALAESERGLPPVRVGSLEPRTRTTEALLVLLLGLVVVVVVVVAPPVVVAVAAVTAVPVVPMVVEVVVVVAMQERSTSKVFCRKYIVSFRGSRLTPEE